jgi:hypothetical protein
MARDLLPLDEATERLRPFARRYVGIRPIEVERMVWTDSRGGDFDREFRARRRDVRERQRRVRDAFPAGDFPPITVYKLGDAYFVLDGHHRVALALRLTRASTYRWSKSSTTSGSTRCARRRPTRTVSCGCTSSGASSPSSMARSVFPTRRAARFSR